MLQVIWTGKAVGGNRRLQQGTRRWYKNPAYGYFQTDLGKAIFQAWEPRGVLSGPVDVFLLFTVNSRRDIDSLVKPVLDCLQTPNPKRPHGAGVITDDVQICQLRVIKQTKPKRSEPDQIYIEVSEITAVRNGEFGIPLSFGGLTTRRKAP